MSCSSVMELGFQPHFLIQGDQKLSVHLNITIHNYLTQYDCLAADRQGQGDIRFTLMPSVIPNSNYVIMVIEIV
jgi:hypothetical protein